MAVISIIPGASGAYSSLPMMSLWVAVACTGAVLIVRRRLWRRMPVFLLHVALLVILAGALVTRLTASTSTLRLAPGESAVVDGDTVCLRSFEVEMYPGTQAPRDFVSVIEVGGAAHTVSMNSPARAGRHVYYQSAYDPAAGTTVLTARADIPGTAVSYTGYALLALAIIWLLLTRGRAAAIAILLLAPAAASAAPRVIAPEAARALGDIYVYHSGRIMPMSTLASDFTLRVTGSTSYRGLSPEQFLSGWLFFYDDWRREPCIKVKGEKAPLALTDFFTDSGVYRFADAAHADANDRFALVSQAAAGSLWRIFPAADSCGLRWLSPVDEQMPELALDDWRLVRHGMGYLAELAVHGRDAELAAAIGRIGRYQRLRAGDDVLPTVAQVRAERVFLAMSRLPWVAVVLLVAGLALTLWTRPLLCGGVAAAGALWTMAMIASGWIASGNIPLTDGPGTMMWLAAGTLAAAALLRRSQAQPLMLTVGALALCVALMGHRQPAISQAVPVLRSPLLSAHVLCVTAAYAMLAVMALCGAAALLGRRSLFSTARRLLRPAVLVLALGIFIGAVWAGQSWGRYWGWDPKEVWALITMLVYSLPLHRRSLPMLGSDRAFAIFTTAAFVTVLITYFGVNFLLGGLHSYA